MDSRIEKNSMGFWEVVDKPTSQELQEYYADKYFQEARGSYELEYSEAERQYFRAKIEQRLAVIEQDQTRMKDERKMLDVGCGEGFALSLFRERGWSVKGIDFSSAGVESKNPECLDMLMTGDVFALLAEEIDREETYDVVWLQNVLEHVIDPVDLLKSLRKLVAVDGMAVVTVPNDCSIIQKAALAEGHIDKAFWVAPPDHLSYFDHAGLKSIAENTGWVCKDILGDLPIDWFLFHPGSNYVKDPSTGKAAHMARVQVENVIHQQPIEDVIRFWSALATVGLGRGITAFLQPGNTD